MKKFVPSAIESALQRAVTAEKIDVAINIFAKPFQTSLTILSLLHHDAEDIGVIWLQFEPMGSRFDKISPYCIARYLTEVLDFPTRIFQPDVWLARDAPTLDQFADATFRSRVRYQHAFENSSARLLFLTHNDVYILRNILGPLRAGIDAHFAMGSLGQCWNCPASNADIMANVMEQPPCTPDTYLSTRPDYARLCALYEVAQKKGIFVRPYFNNGLCDDFRHQPWPLPECRINEWCCLLNLEKTRPLCIPHGEAWPPGAFKMCNGHNLDVGVPWFRDMHASGMTAKNFKFDRYMRHWVGTGNKSPTRYAHAEDNAKRLLQRHYPEYMHWLEQEGNLIG